MPAAKPIRLTRAQSREVDRLSAERFHIPGIVLMENASRGVSDVARQMCGGLASPRILILCGGGNNGGDGLAAARHLHNAGYAVTIGLATDPSRYKGDALTNWQIVQAMRLPTFEATPAAIASTYADVIIDALFGTGLTQPPREPFGALVDAIGRQRVPVLAVDLPSGLDCDTGLPLGATVRSTRTVTFVAEKSGFANPAAHEFTGKISVAGIGCPRELVEEIVGCGRA